MLFKTARICVQRNTISMSQSPGHERFPEADHELDFFRQMDPAESCEGMKFESDWVEGELQE